MLKHLAPIDYLDTNQLRRGGRWFLSNIHYRNTRNWRKLLKSLYLKASHTSRKAADYLGFKGEHLRISIQKDFGLHFTRALSLWKFRISCHCGTRGFLAWRAFRPSIQKHYCSTPLAMCYCLEDYSKHFPAIESRPANGHSIFPMSLSKESVFCQPKCTLKHKIKEPHRMPVSTVYAVIALLPLLMRSFSH